MLGPGDQDVAFFFKTGPPRFAALAQRLGKRPEPLQPAGTDFKPPSVDSYSTRLVAAFHWPCPRSRLHVVQHVHSPRRAGTGCAHVRTSNNAANVGMPPAALTWTCGGAVLAHQGAGRPAWPRRAEAVEVLTNRRSPRRRPAQADLVLVPQISSSRKSLSPRPRFDEPAGPRSISWRRTSSRR